MTYTIKDHGVWRAYTPDPMPDWVKDMPEGYRPAFIKRESDGMDYYEYRKTEGTLSANTVVAHTLYYPSTEKEVVKAVYKDQSLAFPVGQRLIEIIGVDPAEQKPHNLFTEMVYDPTTQTLSGEPGLKFRQVTLKKDLWSRVTDAEADAIEAWLSKQTARQQRMFNDALVVSHDDDLYEVLLKAFIEMFKEDRANVLLAPSK